jgi:hypothetical protein
MRDNLDASDVVPMTKTPVPAEIIQEVLDKFDEKVVLEEIRQIKETGGLKFADFYDELVMLARLKF